MFRHYKLAIFRPQALHETFKQNTEHCAESVGVFALYDVILKLRITVKNYQRENMFPMDVT
jgi:hypothetical protein